ESPPVALTPDFGGPVVAYADGVYDKRLNRYITVREDRRESVSKSVTTIVAIELNESSIQDPKVLIGGNDFYAFPRLDPEGKRIAWIEWSHPNMPWDRSQLWVGYISDNGDVYKRVCVAGADPTIVESPTEPKWSPQADNKVVPVYSLEAEFTRPSWVFGINSYEIIDEQKHLIACSYRQKGRSYLGVLDVNKSALTNLQIPFTDLRNITRGFSCLYVEGASAVHPWSIAKVTLDDQASKVLDFKIIWSSSPTSLKYESYFSSPEFIEFPTEIPGEKAYAYYYPPTNPMYQASKDEKPPLLLESHGYGRKFRERLLKNWGIVDVNDCCSCAQFLVDSGKADGERLCITGCSAGGYTTLAALAFKNIFKAGASLFGVADVKLLKAQIVKFEAYYIDSLIGSEEDFRVRNPINSVDQFSCPVILFHGLEDQVVNPEQARIIYKALKSKGLPVALVEYEGEQHGFRLAENIKFTLEQQMVFFARLVGRFKVADEFKSVKIDNFD
ncbi:hypothetical protein M8C21_018200, partial [Ambrosia artemisiifolia]